MKVIMTKILRVFSGLRERILPFKNKPQWARVMEDNVVLIVFFFLFLTTAFFDSCCHNGSVVKLLKVCKGLSYTILFPCFTYTHTDIKRNLFIFGTVIE